MKNTDDDNSPKGKEPVDVGHSKADEEVKQGGKNSTYPQEYEESESMALRMKPQPLDQPEKKADEDLTKGE